jgi:hypothetical protein
MSGDARTVFGGGAIGACVVAVVVCVLLCVPVVARADFGFVPGSLSVVAHNADGTIDRQAGSHPYSYEVSFVLKKGPEGKTEGGEARDLIVDLPAGFLGNPQAVPQCPRSLFEGFIPRCPSDTQIGVIYPTVGGGLTVRGPMYNMQPPAGVAAQFGFSAAAFNALQNARIRSEEGYGAELKASLPTELQRVSVTVWGVPPDPSHDPERGPEAGGNGEDESSSAPLQPFLTMPTSCGAPPVVTVKADSKDAPGVYSEISTPALDAGGNPAGMTGCESVPFSPGASSQPTTRLTERPSGLDFELAFPDLGWLAPDGIAETQPERVEVALPEGVTANPSVAVGVATCSEAQYHAQGPSSGPGEGCPEASKLGSIVAHSPLLDEPIEGAVYLATPYANPTSSLVGVYLVAKAGERGVMIKQAGSVDPNPTTGQLVANFAGLPPLPYTDFHLHFREGPRAPLVSPPVCGTFTTTTRLTPFSDPTEPRTLTSAFTIDHGVQGGPCPSSGTPPFAPGLVAGTLNNRAGSYSPLYLRISRNDGEQQITGFSAQLPPGLTGNLTGVPTCGEAEVQHAREQTGVEAETISACPVASEIGHTVAEAGVGSVLAQTPGKLYLGGAFEGAPFSIVSVTSAHVGPFDLGTVVVHLPLHIDPNTAKITIPPGPANQIPHIIKGIVIHLRTIRVYVDREHFTINPTNCETMSLGSTVIGGGADPANPADGNPVTATDRYQAADCANLAFKPSFQVSTSGKTSKANGASLTVKLAYPNAPQGTQANIRKVKVDLPKQLPSRLTTLQKACTAAQFHTNPAGCPAASVVGHARAITPILPVPLEGPAYFVSNGGEAFPNLVMVLQGYGLTIDLTGDTFIDKAGVTSSTFPAIPDQPVTSFELILPEGPNSALAANGNLCTSKLTTPNEFVGQNGATFTQNTKVTVTGCPKTKTITRAQKLKLALKACHKKKGAKRKACERAARKKYGPLKKAKKAKR